MTAASWESKRRGSMFAASESRDERRVSVRDPLSDAKASALPTDEVSLQLSVGLLGRCWSLIWTSYAWTFTAWAKNPVISSNLGTAQQDDQLQLIPSRTRVR